MSIADEMAIFKGWCEKPLQVVAPPSRADTIREVWRVAGGQFNYERGKMHVEHDLGLIEPVDFEMNRYGNLVVIEAEGVIVRRIPILR